MKPPPTECKKHGEIKFISRSGGGWRCSKCASEAVMKSRRKTRQTLLEEAGGKCHVCGYDKCPWVLQFHHRDSKEKSFGLSSRGLTKSLARLREEAKKCVLLCANCHAEVEYEKYHSWVADR